MRRIAISALALTAFAFPVKALAEPRPEDFPRPTVSHAGAARPGSEAPVASAKPAQSLQARLASGGAEPREDAVRAAQRGDFRFVWAFGLGFRAPMGLVCNVPLGWAGRGASLAEREFSDSLPDDCDRTPGLCRFQSQLDTYGPAYNRALVDQPRFPAADVCRPSAAVEQAGGTKAEFLRFATPARDIRTPAHDLHEAARRGTLAEVRRELGRSRVDDTDMFGLTPLAWATVRDRREVVRALLAAGAQPFPEFGRGGYRRSPIWLGYRFGRGEIVRSLLARFDTTRLKDDRDDFIPAAVEGGDAGLLRRLLRIAPSDESLSWPFELALKAHRQDLVRVLLESGGGDRASDLLFAAASVGDLSGIHLALAKGAAANGRNSVLGEVVGDHEADEAILGALLDAGADANRITTGASMSGPPLRIAVVHAYRGPFSHDADRETAARQQRIILRLVEAGAQDRTHYPEQAPLVFVAVIGWNARNAPTPGADVVPLPDPILRALVGAGMDLNETYKGRTVLDWMRSAQADPLLADRLRALGARDGAPEVIDSETTVKGSR